MPDDPIVAEVRRLREEHAARFNYDIDAIFEDIKRMERESGRAYVSYPPRRVEPSIRPMKKKHTLEELLNGITPENLHPEIDFGPPPGDREK